MFEAEVVFVVHVEQCVLLWVPGEGFSEGGFPREQREHRVVGHEVGREEVDHIVLADGGIVHEGVEGQGRLCLLEQLALRVSDLAARVASARNTAASLNAAGKKTEALAALRRSKDPAALAVTGFPN